MRKRCSILLLTLAVPALPQPSVAPEILLLARIKAHAHQGLAHIPAYACTETMERYHRNFQAHFFRRQDKIKLEVAEIGGKELFAKAGDKAFEDRALHQIVPAGLTGTGMFFQIATGVFGASATQFHYVGEEKVKGRRTVRYDYDIDVLFSKYQLTFNGHHGVAGVKGAFWADRKSLDVVKLTIEAVAIPAELGLRSATTEIYYGPARFGNDTFLVPLASRIVVMMRDGQGSRNDVRFEDCRKYTGEAKLTFEE